MSTTTECPVCAGLIQRPTDAETNELLTCTDCGSDLEITVLSPFTVQELPQQAEDWGE